MKKTDMAIFEINKVAFPIKPKIIEKGKIFNEPFLIEAIKEDIWLCVEVNRLVINFEECTFNRNVFFDINLKSFKMNQLLINFNNCFILGDDLAYKNSIIISEDCEFHLNFYSCILENITFDNVEITRLSVINSIIQTNYLTVRDCNISSIQIYNLLGKYGVHRTRNCIIEIGYRDDNLYIPPKAIIERMENLGKKYSSIFAFPTSIHISDAKVLNVTFNKSDNVCLKRLFNESDQYFLNESQVNSLKISLHIHSSNQTFESIKLDNARLEALEITNFSNAVVDINRSKINNIYFHQLSFKNLKIYDLSSQSQIISKFEANDVDFSDSTFDKVDLSSYNLVSFYKSTLNKIYFISPKFPQEIHALKNIHNPEQREENYKRMQSENYRQIKNSLESSGNQVNALEMHTKMYSCLQEDKSLSTQDKIILFLNEVSNNHGTSIDRPFILFCVISFFLFFFYRSTLNEAPYKVGFSDIESFQIAVYKNVCFVMQDFKSLWILMDPTHKISTLENIEPQTDLNAWSLFISYLSRILIAWIYYQFIISFRKFGRKL